MNHDHTPDGQLSLLEIPNHNLDGHLSFLEIPILIRKNISSREIKEELKLKLKLKIGKKDSQKGPQIEQINKLTQFARENKSLEFKTDDGGWIASPVEKTDTGYYRWNLLFCPTEC